MDKKIDKQILKDALEKLSSKIFHKVPAVKAPQYIIYYKVKEKDKDE